MEVLFPCGDLLLTCRRNQFRPLVADSFCGSSICGSVDALKAGADKPQMVKLRECLTDISHLGEATGVLRYFLLPIFEQIVVRLRHLHYGIQVLFLRTLRHGIDAAFDAFSDFRFHRADLCEKVLVHMEFVHDNGCTGQAFLYITTVSAGHVHCDYLNICVVIDHVFYRMQDSVALVVLAHFQQAAAFTVHKDRTHIVYNVFFVDTEYPWRNDWAALGLQLRAVVVEYSSDSRGIEIDGETEEYAFDLNEFFETKNSKFVHNESVNKFLDALTTQTKFPFSTDELRHELKHTFWLLNRVDSAKALAIKLKEHPVFSQYEIIVAAGDGKLDDSDETQKSFDKVREAIANHDRTITLSVGQLTTGVTIPEWTAVLMLSNVKSPALYMQAAFRAQNPWMYCENGKWFRKENAYVFDFDPARTLTIFEEFANDLSSDTASGRGDMDTRKQHIRELLNFFPVIGEDEQGEMIALDAEKVLSIPRKIRSQEVVRRGFMSNYLFQNISGIFSAPQEVIDIISKFTPAEEPKAKDIPVTPNTKLFFTKA